MEQDIAYVLRAFAALAAIPRPSGQERAVSDFLKRWGQAQRLTVIQDADNNIIMEKAASPGCERAPRAILQAHMDMVYVSEAQDAAGETPLLRPVRIRENPEERTLSAEASSLGADDGIGVAMIQYLLQARDLRHGPLRAVITTNEEAGMSGAYNLDARHLDAAYLINIDWERYGSLCNSCADIHVYRFRRSLSPRASRQNSARRLVVSGLAGGHSGIDIHKGRTNALCAATQILRGLRRAGIDFELADFRGGTAANAIPARAEAILCLDAARTGHAERLVAEAAKNCKAACTDEDARISFAPCPAPQGVLPTADANALLRLLAAMPDGVRAMSQSIPDFVESSSNLGLLRMNECGVTAEAAARSSVPWHTEAMRHSFESLAELSGFDLDIPSAAPAWPMKAGSLLTEYAGEAFKEICGRPMTIDPVHAGLECGIFAVRNPALDMISLGPRIDNAHSVAETLHLDGLSDTLRCIEKILEKITLSFLLDNDTRKA